MAKSHKIFTIAQALSYIEERCARISRMPTLYGFRSLDFCKSYKSLISICNSLSIVFLQYNLFKESFLMLQKAVEIDSDLTKFGNSEDKIWQGRLVTLGKNKESLKLLFQAENFLFNLTQSKISPNIDIEISVNMLTFVTLWRVKKFSDSVVYLERSAKLVNEVLSGKKVSNISVNSCKNLYGIIVMGLAAVKCTLEKDPKLAIAMCKDALRQLDGTNVLSRPLVLDFMKHIQKNSKFLTNFSLSTSIEFRPGKFSMFESKENYIDSPKLKLKHVSDWLLTENYEKVLFITTFVPLISPLTPWIDTNELEKASAKGKTSGNSDIFGKIQQKLKPKYTAKKELRTESTPRPRPPKSSENSILKQRKLSQDSKYTDRSFTSYGDNRHIMFGFSTGSDFFSSDNQNIDLIPIQPKGHLPNLHRTLINFKGNS